MNKEPRQTGDGAARQSDAQRVSIGLVPLLALVALPFAAYATYQKCVSQESNPEITSKRCNQQPAVCVATEWGDTTQEHMPISGPQRCITTSDSQKQCTQLDDEACYIRMATNECILSECPPLAWFRFALSPWEQGTVPRATGNPCNSSE